MKERSKTKIIGLVLVLIQLLVSAMVSIQFWKMGFLPTRYWSLITGVLLVLFLCTLLLQFVNKIHWIGKILSVLISAALIFGFVYVNQTHQTLKDITKKTSIEKEQILVVVQKDHAAQTLLDLKEASWGVQYADDVELMGKAVDAVTEKLGNSFTLTAFDNYSALYPALMDGGIDAMILNSSYLDLIDELTAEEEGYYFSNEIRIIERLEFETEKAVEADAKEREDFDITKDPFIVYVSGIDTYGDISTRSRSDVNILMAVNPVTRQILLLTTPRDAYVVIPGISGNQKDKLTHAGIYGVEKSIDTLDAIYDMEIDYYARVNFNSLIRIVDALGGVDVYSANAFTVGDVTYQQGYNTLNGEEALTFSRERYALADGDNQRGRNQMEVIKGIVNKATSPAILTGFQEILEEVSDQVQTSMPAEDLYALVKMQLGDMQSWEMFSFDTKATGSREYCYSYTGKSLYVANLQKSSIAQAKQLLETILSGGRISEADVAQ